MAFGKLDDPCGGDSLDDLGCFFRDTGYFFAGLAGIGGVLMQLTGVGLTAWGIAVSKPSREITGRAPTAPAVTAGVAPMGPEGLGFVFQGRF